MLPVDLIVWALSVCGVPILWLTRQEIWKWWRLYLFLFIILIWFIISWFEISNTSYIGMTTGRIGIRFCLLRSCPDFPSPLPLFLKLNGGVDLSLNSAPDEVGFLLPCSAPSEWFSTPEQSTSSSRHLYSSQVAAILILTSEPSMYSSGWRRTLQLLDFYMLMSGWRLCRSSGSIAGRESCAT